MFPQWSMILDAYWWRARTVAKLSKDIYIVYLKAAKMSTAISKRRRAKRGHSRSAERQRARHERNRQSALHQMTIDWWRLYDDLTRPPFAHCPEIVRTIRESTERIHYESGHGVYKPKIPKPKHGPKPQIRMSNDQHQSPYGRWALVDLQGNVLGTYILYSSALRATLVDLTKYLSVRDCGSKYEFITQTYS